MIERLIVIEGTAGLRFQKRLEPILKTLRQSTGGVVGGLAQRQFDLTDHALHFARTGDVPRAAGNYQRYDRQDERQRRATAPESHRRPHV